MVEECITFYNHMSLHEGNLLPLDSSGGCGGVEEIYLPLATIYQEISCILHVFKSKICWVYWDDLHVITCMHQDLEGSAHT